MNGIFIFVFGLIMGSFLGVIIDRLPRGESIAKGRSRCEYCDRNLSATELIPILSYVMQKGKCKNCQTKLSLRYPLLEILTGIAYLLSYLKFGLTLKLVFALSFTSILIIITFIDIDTMMIHDRFHVLIILLGILEAIIYKKNILNLVIAAFIISLPLYVVAVVTGGMGGGDIKLMFASGLFLGIKRIIVSFVIASIVGGVYAIYTLIAKNHNRKDAIPFGPFLCIGLFISMLYGAQISAWYLAFLP